MMTLTNASATSRSSTTKSTFKSRLTLEQRLAESKRIRAKYPQSIPLICEYSGDGNLPAVDKCKFLVPRDFTTAQFMFVLRKRISIDSHKAVFIFYGNDVLASSSDTFGMIYERMKDDDGFLYAKYSGENTFGG